MALFRLIDSNKTRPLTFIEGDVAVYLQIPDEYNYKYKISNISKRDLENPISEYISRKYSKHFMGCWLLTLDPISYEKESLSNKNNFQLILGEYLLHKHIIDQDYDIIAVCQHAYHNGLHCHFCVLTRAEMSKEEIANITKVLNGKFEVEHGPGKIKQYEFVSHYQKIKSTCSYLNYLQNPNKGTFFTITSNKEMHDLFIYFNKDVIFPTGSVAKRAKLTDNNIYLHSDNELVLFFMKKLHNNVSDYNTILQDSNIQRFLHIHNLKMIWENCLSQFRASLNHEKNLVHIATQIKECYKYNNNILCPCAMIELLKVHDIDHDMFARDLLMWLLGTDSTQKKNTLLLMGPPDSGKSFFARKLWELFYMHERLINDGLFTFAPAPGAGCLIWEETHISPELADMTKLIMEGDPSVAVAIKNKASQTLNKRIPLIITNNKEMGVYCQESQGAFNARCFRYTFKNRLPFMCDNLIHECPFVYPIDTPNRQRARSYEINSRLFKDYPSEEACITDCTGFHSLTSYSVLGFILYAYKFHTTLLAEIEAKNIYSRQFWELFNFDNLDLCEFCQLVQE